MDKLTPPAFCIPGLQRAWQNWSEAPGNTGGYEDQCHMYLTLSQYSLLLGDSQNKKEGEAQKKSNSKDRSKGSYLTVLWESFSIRENC